ncbi:hypothetical protein [Streptomyces parvulus]|uniref:hypothetical protein n=1 Tax=Streptomyces parvulus TaxID=146923 RepID=UPI0034108AE9
MGARLVRALGAVTAVYSAAIMIRPVWLVRPYVLVDANRGGAGVHGDADPRLGARDVAI